MRATVVALLVGFAGVASAHQAPPLPERWLAAGDDFGALRVAYRLTDDCDIDPDFEIVESPNLAVTHDEVRGLLTSFLGYDTRDDVPRDVVMRVMEDVFGEEAVPTRPMTQDEYDRVISEFERLGPWPQIRFVTVESSTFRCSLDVSGNLVRVERSDAGKDLFRDFDEDLSEQGPFFLRWDIDVIEE